MSTATNPNSKQSQSSSNALFVMSGAGATSRAPVNVAVYQGPAQSGINFHVVKSAGGSGNFEFAEIPANADFVVNTLRNVVLGVSGARLCLVEHILAAIALWGAEDLIIKVNGPEIPLDDGSASIWIKHFEQSGLPRKLPEPYFDISEPIVCSKGDRQIIAIPDKEFSINYLMDWDHPLLGKRWCRWNRTDDIGDIAEARTFGMESEQIMLGLKDNFVSITADGFSKPLRYENEPVRHKLLDLLGDLSLIGVNPLSIKAQIISIKGGHELDVQMAQALKQCIKKIEE